MSGDGDGNDDDLRKRFHELKAHDARNAPSFETVVARGRPTQVRTSAGSAGATRGRIHILIPIVTSTFALAAAVLLVIWFSSSSSQDAANATSTGGEDQKTTPSMTNGTNSPAPAIARLDPAPLDFLLDTSPKNPIKGW